MASAPPTPLRPLCRTRRRSSSLSAILAHDDLATPPSSSPDRSSPAAASSWHHHRSPSRPDAKRAKRTRVGYQGGEPKPPSPLKQSQHALFPPPEEDSDFALWTHPSPFAAAYPNPPLVPAFAPSLAQPLHNPAAPAAFCTSASAFALPGLEASAARFQRSRNASTESTFFPSRASLSSSKGSFDDSSFGSDSPPRSVPSASTSPEDPTAAALFACVAGGSSAPTQLAVAPTPPLRRASSCISPMLCDGAVELATPVFRADEFGEAERLHHVAFEALRAATRAGEEDFVERMRRWEAERGETLVLDDAAAAASVDDDVEAGDEEDEIEVTLDLGSSSLQAHPPAVSHTELDELSRRLRAGACELEDYALVREVQARSRSRSAGTRA
ncbi:hypothetical protein JCM3770_005171 [Rhodotorula araucariae]